MHRNVSLDLILNRIAHYSSGKLQSFAMIKTGIDKMGEFKCQNYNKKVMQFIFLYIIVSYIHAHIVN